MKKSPFIQPTAIERLVKRVFVPNSLSKEDKPSSLFQKVSFRWHRVVKRLLPLGGASEGNKIQIYSNGDDAFRSMWHAIDQAKDRVWMETYILEADTVGRKTIDHLIKACNRGCDVRLIYDYVGSKKLNNSHLAEFRAAGGQVVPFNPIFKWPWYIQLSGLYRNHRKLLVIDDKMGFCGGMNIGNEYAGKEVGGSAFFRDTHLKVQGPAVTELANVFIKSLKEAKAPPPPMIYEGTTLNSEPVPLTQKTKSKDKTEKGQAKKTKNDGVFVQILESNVRRNSRHIQRSLVYTMKEASSHCYITTPYFLPPHNLKQAILDAANRGVEVRILTSGLSDVPLVTMAGQHVYNLFLRNNVRIFEYFGGTLHAKTFTVDSVYSSIGSFNLDPWSHFYNLELILVTLDHKVAAQLEEDFEKDLANATEVTLADMEKRSLIQRFTHWLIYHCLRVF